MLLSRKRKKKKKTTSNTGNGTRSLDLLRSHPMFVGTEKNLTIYVSQKLRKQKPEISQLGRCTFLSVQGAFLPFCSVLRVDKSPLLYCILQIVFPFSTAPEICSHDFCFLLEKDKTIFPDRRKNCIPFSMIWLWVSSLCGNVLRNNN